VAVGRAESPGQIHRLAQDYAIGNFRRSPELVQTEPQRGMLDRVELVGRDLAPPGELPVELLERAGNFPEQRLEIGAIGPLRIRSVHDILECILPRRWIDLHPVERLESEAPCVTPGRMLAPPRARGRVHDSIRRSRFAISIAVSAASAPLLPALPPARS